MPNSQVNRWFYRCTGCLEVVALPEQLPIEFSRSKAECSTCGQHFELMGRVQRDRLVQDHTACVCDERCTFARGPHCDCKCSGENHGIGMAGYIMRTVDAGPIPRVSMPDTKSRARSLAAWQQYSSARAQALAELDRLLQAARAAGWLERAQFDRLRAIQRALHAGAKARTHAARLKVFRRVRLSGGRRV